MRSVAVVLGTRPEAIKFAPVIQALRDDPRFDPIVISTGHVELNLSKEKNRICALMKPYELTDLLHAIGVVTAPAA